MAAVAWLPRAPTRLAVGIATRLKARCGTPPHRRGRLLSEDLRTARAYARSARPTPPPLVPVGGGESHRENRRARSPRRTPAWRGCGRVCICYSSRTRCCSSIPVVEMKVFSHFARISNEKSPNNIKILIDFRLDLWTIKKRINAEILLLLCFINDMNSYIMEKNEKKYKR